MDHRDPADAAFDPLAADLALFGCWQAAPAYGEGALGGNAFSGDPPVGDPLVGEVCAVLETKSAETPAPAEELRRLLNEMTVEMREQFEGFRDMRVAAERLLESGDEAAGKLARADIKAATDAMSLIVRTLEKVDSLQRQLARDRADEAERAAEAGGYAEAKQRFIQMIGDRAHEKALRLYQTWQRDGPPEWVSERIGRPSAQPAHGEAQGGETGGQDGEGFGRQEPGQCDDRDGAAGGGAGERTVRGPD